MDSICLDFLNSVFREYRGKWVKDRLQDPQWQREFLERWDVQEAGLPDAETLIELVTLRASMERIIATVATGAPADEDLRELNRSMRQAVPVPCLLWDGERYQLELVPLKKDWHWVIAEIATSLADMLVHADTRRLKICENPHCLYVFYDESKSRTKRYCCNDKCGNLMKLRRYRARHKEISRK